MLNRKDKAGNWLNLIMVLGWIAMLAIDVKFTVDAISRFKDGVQE